MCTSQIRHSQPKKSSMSGEDEGISSNLDYLICADMAIRLQFENDEYTNIYKRFNKFTLSLIHTHEHTQRLHEQTNLREIRYNVI